MANLGSVITAMATPFAKDLTVDLVGAKRLASYLVEHGSDGLVVAGTTGESPTLTADEKLALFQVVREEVAGKAVVFAGTGSNSTEASIDLSQKAQEIGVDGLMLVVPYYNKPSQEGLYQHFRSIAAAVSLPIMLYNVPSRTSRNMDARTVIRLAEIENIVAVKEASGDFEQVALIRKETPDSFSIYSGEDALTLPLLTLGARGVVSVASHIVGPKIATLISAYFEGNIAEATRIHLSLLDVFKAMFITTNPVPVKAALNMLGLPSGGLRLPLLPATKEEEDLIRRVLLCIGLNV